MKDNKKGTKKKSSKTTPKKNTKKTTKKVAKRTISKPVTKKKKVKRGFTLIELLSVIVILGLLMAIAIPSVTRYINQSRMKTLVTTIEGYIDAASISVNDNEFGKMSNQDNIYYIPISNIKDDSCVSLEKGGVDPFGDYIEAYVVVHYNAAEYKYDYYFTFIDSAGYGMELTKREDIKSSGKGQIKNPSPINPSTSDSNTITSQTVGDAVPHLLSTDSCSAANSTVVGTGNGGFTPIPGGGGINPSLVDNKMHIKMQTNACTYVTNDYSVPKAKMKFSTWVNSSANTDGWWINTNNEVVLGETSSYYKINGVTGSSYITIGKTYNTTPVNVHFNSIICGNGFEQSEG